jgi:hypothetical protein
MSEAHPIKSTIKARRLFGLVCVALLIASAAVLALGATRGHADPNLPNVPPHRHWINGQQVGPDICDNLGDPATQHAFNEFHNNLHVATGFSIGPAAPGLHNGHGGEIAATPCSVTTPPN